MKWLAHGAAIHVPLALGVLFPLLYLGALWARKTNWLPSKIWSVLWLIGMIQIASTWFAYASGERSKILSGADADQILKHENLAYQFIGVWLVIVFLLGIVVWMKSSTVLKVAHGLLIVLLIAQMLICIYLGQVGGTLMG